MVGWHGQYSDEEKRRAVALVVDEHLSVDSVSNELGIDGTMLHEWISQHWARDWADQVAVHFGWLSEHGFQVTEMDASWFWAWAVVYRHSPAAVVITQNREYWEVEVRLVAGEDVPLAQRHIRVDDEITGVSYLSKLVWLRAPEPAALLDSIVHLGLTRSEMDSQLEFWAGILRTWGQDFLHGDLSILDVRHPIIRPDRRRSRKLRKASYTRMSSGPTVDGVWAMRPQTAQ